MGLLICYTYFFPRWADPNQNSRLDMVFAVVEDGTFQIDAYVGNTVDYAKIGSHYYSDKAPGAAFLGIPVYAVLSKILDLAFMDTVMEELEGNQAFQATLRERGTGLLRDKVRFAIAQVVLSILVSAIPSALLGVLMYSALGQFTVLSWPRIAVALGYGFTTPVFAYAGALYGHQLSAACLFGAFYLVWARRRLASVGTLLVVGGLLGYSVITEYPSALVAGILFVYTLTRLEDKRYIGWSVLAGATIAVGWMVYNSAVFGAPLELGYSHSELWLDQHHTGFMSLTRPRLQTLWGITFSPYRGLFLLSPWLLFSVPGFYLWYRSRKYRAELWVVLSSTAAMFLFNASSIMWWGGFAIGPRYLLAALPFLAIPALFPLYQWRYLWWVKAVFGALCAWSLAAVWGLSLAGQAFPPDTIRNPLVDYALPAWRAGNIARNLGMFLHLRGVLSLLPLFTVLFVLAVTLWTIGRPAGKSGDQGRSCL